VAKLPADLNVVSAIFFLEQARSPPLISSLCVLMPTVLISSPHSIPWYRHFPDGETVWEGWRFLFNDAQGIKYDYLVAFEDLEKAMVFECPPANTIHVGAEPPDIRRYNHHYLNQFGMVLTVDSEVVHPHAIHIQPGINWFIGWDSSSGGALGAMSFRDIEKLFDQPKRKLISVIASNKSGSLGHRKRLAFAQRLKAYFGDRIDFYGRGFTPMVDKLDALKDYRFHVVLENSQHRDYFTEKVSDCIMAGCYPLYWGCPNLKDYLPEDSFIAIDIDDFELSVLHIERAISLDLDITHRDALREARRKIMYEYNLFPMLRRILSAHADGFYGDTTPRIRYGSALHPLASPLFKKRLGVVRRFFARTKVT
jgi:hypothetical protein